jgi:cytochrome oxidase Cu insertion factor (SCO1/SenC/PrrC family)
MSGSFDRRRLVGVLLVVLLLLVFAAVLSACGSGTSKSAWGDAVAGKEPAADGKPAPAFSGVTLGGKAVTLDQFRGKPLLLVYMTST